MYYKNLRTNDSVTNNEDTKTRAKNDQGDKSQGVRWHWDDRGKNCSMKNCSMKNDSMKNCSMKNCSMKNDSMKNSRMKNARGTKDRVKYAGVTLIPQLWFNGHMEKVFTKNKINF